MVDKILVLGVDRDNDIGEKTGIIGPILGKAAIKEAAFDLGVADPTESDTNVLFQCIKLYDRLIEENKETYVAIVTGDKSVGVKSDMIISEQLDEIINSYGTKSVILVSDGKEDENILPIVQSKMTILSVERVTVQQSESLEDTYFILHTYLKRLMEDRKVSGLLLGIPGIIIIIYGLTYIFPDFTKYGSFAAFSILGLYLFIKGFGIDDYLGEKITPGKIKIVAYSVAIVIAIYGGYNGFNNIHWSMVPYLNIESVRYVFTAFFDGSFPLLYIGIIAALAGNVISAYLNNVKRFWTHMIIFILACAIFGTVYQYTSYTQNEITSNEMTFSLIFISFVTILGTGISFLQRSKVSAKEKKRRFMPFSRRGIITLFFIAMLVVSGILYLGEDSTSVPIDDVSFIITNNLADQNRPYMGETSDGRLYVLWQDNRNGNWDIYLKYLDTLEVINVTNDSFDQINPRAWQDKVVWQDNRNGNWDIYMYAIDTSALKQVTDDEYNQISPDIYQEKVVWEDERNGNADIYLYNDTTGNEIRITVDETGFQPFQTSPRINGNIIVWLDNRFGEFNIFSYNIITSEETAITSGRSIKFNPSIDGNLIVWEDNRNGNWDIYTYNISESQELQLTTNPYNQVNPCISGNYVAWDDDRAGNKEIYVFNTEIEGTYIISETISDQEKPNIFGNYMVWVDWRNDLDGIETDIPEDNPDIYAVNLEELEQL